MFKSSDRASLQHAQLDAQAEEEELPPNPSAEIPMADPATVDCDDDVEVNSVFDSDSDFSDSDFSPVSDLE